MIENPSYGHFRARVTEGGKIVHESSQDTPFIEIDVRPTGPLDALRVLFGRYRATVEVRGSAAAHRVVQMGDYRIQGADLVQF